MSPLTELDPLPTLRDVVNQMEQDRNARERADRLLAQRINAVVDRLRAVERRTERLDMSGTTTLSLSEPASAPVPQFEIRRPAADVNPIFEAATRHLTERIRAASIAHNPYLLGMPVFARGGARLGDLWSATKVQIQVPTRGDKVREAAATLQSTETPTGESPVGYIVSTAENLLDIVLHADDATTVQQVVVDMLEDELAAFARGEAWEPLSRDLVTPVELLLKDAVKGRPRGELFTDIINVVRKVLDAAATKDRRTAYFRVRSAYETLEALVDAIRRPDGTVPDIDFRKGLDEAAELL